MQGMAYTVLRIRALKLANGNIVELGDFGSFRLTIQTSGEKSAEAVNAGNIKNVKVVFMPGKLFKQSLAQIEFKKA